MSEKIQFEIKKLVDKVQEAGFSDNSGLTPEEEKRFIDLCFIHPDLVDRQMEKVNGSFVDNPTPMESPEAFQSLVDSSTHVHSEHKLLMKQAEKKRDELAKKGVITMNFDSIVKNKVLIKSFLMNN